MNGRRRSELKCNRGRRHDVGSTGAIPPARKGFVCPGLILLTALATAASAQPTPDDRKPEPRFATVNGIKLHYLDWGGTGAALLFLTSLGGSAGDFQPLAINFTGHFHVLGLTRRGQGQSDKPDTGYGTSQLVDDIRAFLDLMHIKRATLVGFSLAGNELTEFASLYPRRVVKLVYLDAAYDLAENAELGRKAQLNLPPVPGSDKATLELIARSNEYHPDYTRIRAPALGFFVTYDKPPQSSLWDEATKAKLLAWWYDYGKDTGESRLIDFRRT